MSVESGQVFTKNAYAYQELRRRILAGEMKPGQSIAQGQLALELGVSTTPLREALRRLDAEGLVSISAHRDAQVATLSPDEERSLQEIRRRLDPLATRLAAERRTEEDIATIERTLAHLQSFDDNSGGEYRIAHRSFHRALYNASHNDLLISTLEGLWDKAERYRQARISSKRITAAELKVIKREHAQIAASVIAEDEVGAELAMEVHMRIWKGQRPTDAV